MFQIRAQIVESCPEMSAITYLFQIPKARGESNFQIYRTNFAAAVPKCARFYGIFRKHCWVLSSRDISGTLNTKKSSAVNLIHSKEFPEPSFAHSFF